MHVGLGDIYKEASQQSDSISFTRNCLLLALQVQQADTRERVCYHSSSSCNDASMVAETNIENKSPTLLPHVIPSPRNLLERLHDVEQDLELKCVS